MCGIVGVIQKNNYGLFAAQEDSFFQMLYADVLRGADSTGVIGVERHGGFHIAKEAIEATWVIPQIKAEPFFKEKMSVQRAEGKCWIGHNRKSTVGKTTDENAHPFVINDEFALVHNGTLYNHERLAKTDVDSEALAMVLHEAMGKDNWKESLEEVLGQVNGAYATAWYDQRSGKVHLLRNSQRPLAVLETNSAFYWASEPAMAWWILGRNGVKHDEIKHYNLGENHLITFNLENTKMEVTELTPKKATAPVKTSTHTSKTGANTTQTSGEVATNHWTKSNKRNFRAAWVGRSARFWVDDYFEAEPGTSIASGADSVWLMGEMDDLAIKHQIRAMIRMSDLKLHYAEDLTDRIWMGMIDSVEFEKPSGFVTLYIDNAKPVVVSSIVQRILDASKGKKKTEPLSHKTGCVCAECQGLPKPPFPQVSSVSKAVQERVDLLRRNYEESYGELDQVVTANGKIQLVIKTGNLKGQILYETPIALH